MVVLRDIRKTVDIALPSFPESKVTLYQGLLFGQMKELEVAKTDLERGMLILRLMIKDWNFTDEAGEKLAVSEKNLNVFPMEDLTLLLEKTAEYFSETVKKNRKNLKS